MLVFPWLYFKSVYLQDFWAYQTVVTSTTTVFFSNSDGVFRLLALLSFSPPSLSLSCSFPTGLWAFSWKEVDWCVFFHSWEGEKSGEKKGPGKQREVVCAGSASRKRNSLRTRSLLSSLLSPVGPGLVLDYSRDKDKHEDIETLNRKKKKPLISTRNCDEK